MSQWAILSGIQGNLAAYEAVLQDIKRQRESVETLFVLGDVIGATDESEKLVERLQHPKSGELKPQLCQGWWEEQALILYGLGRTGDPVELKSQFGSEMVEKLWKSVSRSTVNWIRSLDFGFQELDCLLIHGSTVSVSDKLSPEMDPMQLLDRVLRADVNSLFCGRSGLTFHVQVQAGSLTDTLITLNGEQDPQWVTLQSRQIIGVGSVGAIPGQATYTLYNPGSDQVQFKTVRYGSGGRGFGQSS